MTATKPPLALLVQVERRFDTYRAVARVVLPQENGDLHSPLWRGYGDTDPDRFDGLEISAYAGKGASDYPSDTDDKLWGFDVHYRPHRVESAAHATAIAKVFGQIERGMAKLQTEDGYIRDGEFARYVTRAARALRIPAIYVRSLPRQEAMSGERYKLVDAIGLDYWCQEVTSKVESRELASLTR